jgi:polyphosphate kinase 2 (PPK2 family)
MAKGKKKDEQVAAAATDGAGPDEDGARRKVKRAVYESEIERLTLELVKLQEHVRANRQRVVVIFEGRDAAGKGGVI